MASDNTFSSADTITLAISLRDWPPVRFFPGLSVKKKRLQDQALHNAMLIDELAVTAAVVHVLPCVHVA